MGFPNLGFLNFGGLLTDLSKAFDCLPHDLLIAKLHAYGLDMPSLELLHFYLTKRRQRVKIDNTYSSWSGILFGVPQGSILGPPLFNIFLWDLFLLYPKLVLRLMLMIILFTPPINMLKLYILVLILCWSGLQVIFLTLSWRRPFLYDNGLRHERIKTNPEKCHLLVSTNE